MPYIAMEFVVGGSLRAYTQDPHVSTETKVGWLIDAARALWAAHKAGLVHRDAKPGNIQQSGAIAVALDVPIAKNGTTARFRQPSVSRSRSAWRRRRWRRGRRRSRRCRSHGRGRRYRRSLRRRCPRA